MFSALVKSFEQLSDHRSLKALVYSALATVFILAITLSVIYYGILALSPEQYGFEGWWVTALEWLFNIISGAGMFFLAYFLFAPVMVGLSGLFAEQIIQHVEEKHYPNVETKRDDKTIWEDLWLTFKTVGFMVLINLILFPFYFIPIIGQIIYIGVNAYLIGKEYFYLVAITHMRQRDIRGLYEANQSRIYRGGILLAVLSLIPFVNLTIIVLGSSLMTHLFHQKKDKSYPTF